MSSIRFFVVFFLVVSFFNSAESAEIRCSNPAYANQTLQFYAYADPVSNETQNLFTLKIDKNGNGSVNIQLSQPVFAFCEFGIYRGMLLLQPETKIGLKLPPLKKKSFSDEKNPYFTPVSFWFYSTDGAQLNDKISKFEQKLNELTDKDFKRLYFQQSKTAFAALSTQLDTIFPETTPACFKLHKLLRLKLIEADIFRLRPEQYSSVFQDIEPALWQQQAFNTLFNKTFDEQLSFSAKAIGGTKISEAVATENIKALIEFISTKYKLTGQVADLVLLKLLHDGFYSNDFSKKAIKNMITSNYFAQNKTPKIKETAKNISIKITFLEKGSEAPAICLANLQGEKHCTNAGNKKFKYIVFADAETIVCQEHLKYLSRINELFGRHLDIFIVLRNTPKSGIDSFFSTHEIPGEKLLDTNAKAIADYKIRSFPQCFLFDENHRVVFNDAKAPLNGFEQQFGSWLQKELFMRQRNQAR
ncbi:redoxin domain-containing protein [uncultured Draconibacterium sp.]|uniref:TlpA family protein disulfide reductase n=1 Tax=uncultured Draconibacterium sp. TaxID=1573823 RepID=UPI0025D9F16C|nr:redoxin domain-containing protein [uncultured Draconibacterium sp.]